MRARIYRENALLIVASHRDGTYLVPSGSEPGKSYEVEPGRSCGCVGYYHHRHCSHDLAATIARAKSFSCDGCGWRFPNTQMNIIGEDSLTFFPDDQLCLGCALAHGEV